MSRKPLQAHDVGGVHAKYLTHCPRQLWLYVRGIRPEGRSQAVQLGESIAEHSYRRMRQIDLGTVRIDGIDPDGTVNEVKSSLRHRTQHDDQARLYLLRLEQAGVTVTGARIRYPRIRRTVEVPWNHQAREQARRLIDAAVEVAAQDHSPGRLDRSDCTGCSFLDYCWA